MKNAPTTKLGCLAMSAWVLGMVLYGMFANAYLLSTTWGWFIAGPLHLPAITLRAAVGIAFVFSLFQPTPKVEDRPEDGDLTKTMLSATWTRLTVPWAMLGIGWLIHQFV